MIASYVSWQANELCIYEYIYVFIFKYGKVSLRRILLTGTASPRYGWFLLLLLLLLLISQFRVTCFGYLYMVYSGPTAATHDLLDWYWPVSRCGWFFSPKIQHFEKKKNSSKIFYNFFGFLEKKNHVWLLWALNTPCIDIQNRSL